MGEKVTITTDYLVVGGGAMGLAFADEMLNMPGGQDNVEIVMVDQHAKPGGHWNDAYDFVTLHQPAKYYGVNSMDLGQSNTDLASKYQILAYFELALKKLQDTGRFKFFSQCDYKGDGKFVSRIDSSLEYEVKARKKIVDASYYTARVPSNTPPKYKKAEEISLMPINGLAKLQKSWQKYVIIGAGKTGIDAVLYLLEQNISPDKIVWIMPNDSWLILREALESDNYAAWFCKAIVEAAASEDHQDFWLRQEKIGYMMRIDKKIMPTKFKCATVSHAEVQKLKAITNIVRQGRIAEITPDKMIFQDGSEYATSTEYLHVDCSSDGLGKKPACPIFQGKSIILQSISMCQQVFSASIIAGLEKKIGDDDAKMNQIVKPVPHPETPNDYFGLVLDTLGNEQRNLKEGVGFLWARRSRLNYSSHLSMFHLMKMTYTYLTHSSVVEQKLEKFKIDTNRGFPRP